MNVSNFRSTRLRDARVIRYNVYDGKTTAFPRNFSRPIYFELVTYIYIHITCIAYVRPLISRLKCSRPFVRYRRASFRRSRSVRKCPRGTWIATSVPVISANGPVNTVDHVVSRTRFVKRFSSRPRSDWASCKRPADTNNKTKRPRGRRTIIRRSRTDLVNCMSRQRRTSTRNIRRCRYIIRTTRSFASSPSRVR